MSFTCLSEVVIAYPPTNDVWKFQDIAFIANQNDFPFAEWPLIKDPWNRNFPNPYVEIHGSGSMSPFSNKVVGWCFMTSVEGFKIQCLVKKIKNNFDVDYDGGVVVY